MGGWVDVWHLHAFSRFMSLCVPLVLPSVCIPFLNSKCIGFILGMDGMALDGSLLDHPTSSNASIRTLLSSPSLPLPSAPLFPCRAEERGIPLSPPQTLSVTPRFVGWGRRRGLRRVGSGSNSTHVSEWPWPRDASIHGRTSHGGRRKEGKVVGMHTGDAER